MTKIVGDVSWGKTNIMLERKEADDEIDWINGEPHFQGRHIIQRDSDIDGGVYLGGGKREAIVVDVEEYGELERMYEDAKDMTRGRDGRVNRHKALKAAFNVARDELEPSEAQLNRLVNRYGDITDEDIDKKEDMRSPTYLVGKINEDWGVENDRKVPLDEYIKEGVGVCRHRALATGAVIEQFQEDGHLTGEVSVDRNARGVSGHAWVRYENSTGDIYILDPMQDVAAPLEETEDEYWNYERPEDL